ncbi:MAG: hypothetical protein V3T78_00645, partial [Dehalococcoidia bacterium]
MWSIIFVDMRIDFSGIKRSTVLRDKQNRLMEFPNRRDYIELLIQEGFISSEKDFFERPDLNEAVYLDWLKRGQVGCIFAQLLGRSHNRKGLFLHVADENSDTFLEAKNLASNIDKVVQEAVGNEEAESLTILLPRVLFIEGFARLNLALSEIEGWRIEREERWRTLTRVGLRIHLGDSVWAEVLGLAPYTQYMPPTRLSPVPSLEIRTKLKG